METNIKQLQTLLKFTYGLVPIVAGLDKFTNLLTDWEHYLSPWLKGIIPVNGNTFMMIVGVVEIIAGIVVLAKPQIGAWIVALWLALIALTLITGGNYFDVAVRDLVMAIGAFVLARLSSITENKLA
ncbi:MAG: hypothetical protein JST32_11585 [Bacteroidetes bacterium]|nr:hypothetical protein [Bacteroidota bacterium]